MRSPNAPRSARSGNEPYSICMARCDSEVVSLCTYRPCPLCHRAKAPAGLQPNRGCRIPHAG